MATTNFNVQDLSSSAFKPINFKSKSARSTREEPYYKSAKVAPSSSTPVVEPKASYPQLSMYDRWTNDCQNVEVVSSVNSNNTVVAPFVQVPMLERWTHDDVG
jgi:hypothetical protein